MVARPDEPDHRDALALGLLQAAYLSEFPVEAGLFRNRFRCQAALEFADQSVARSLAGLHLLAMPEPQRVVVTLRWAPEPACPLELQGALAPRVAPPSDQEQAVAQPEPQAFAGAQRASPEQFRAPRARQAQGLPELPAESDAMAQLWALVQLQEAQPERPPGRLAEL